jgi:hypothetical protein
MTDTERYSPQDDRRRRRAKTPRSRLGKTWQDRNWRQKLLGQISSIPVWASLDERATNRRALPARH